MNFLELQDEVISDRFGADRRGKVKNWINYRYGRLWAAEDWGFKKQSTTLVAAGGVSSVASTGIGDIISFSDITQGTGNYPLMSYFQDEFYEHSVTTAAVPSAYTKIGDTIYFNSVLPTTMTFRVLSKIPFTPLSQDSDVPLIPVEFHYLLVVGAASEGLRQENDPSWQGEEDDYQQGVEDMKSEYISSGRGWSHYPSWP